jgi:hypothetical protein
VHREAPRVHREMQIADREPQTARREAPLVDREVRTVRREPHPATDCFSRGPIRLVRCAPASRSSEVDGSWGHSWPP